MEKYMRVVHCGACDGQRLNPQARSVRVAGKTLIELLAMPLGDLAAWLDPDTGPLETKLTPTQKKIATSTASRRRDGEGPYTPNVILQAKHAMLVHEPSQSAPAESAP